MAEEKRASGGLPVFPDPVSGRPEVSREEAAALAAEHWGISGEAAPLAGERDRNFLLRGEADGERRFVLKVSPAGEPAARLDMLRAVVEHTRKADAGLRIPEALPTLAGENGAEFRVAGRKHRARLLTYLDGTPLSRIRRRPPALLAAAGGLLGRLQNALADFDHPGLEEQEIPWAPRNAEAVIEAGVAALSETADDSAEAGRRADLYERTLREVRPSLPALLSLPSGALHNDANDDNLLLAAGEPETCRPDDLALLDFGDALSGPRIVEAATAALYLSLDAPEPLRAAARVLAGFAAERPVLEEEADLFRVAYAARALVSGGMAALRRARMPETDPYLLVSEAGVFRALAALAGEPAAITTARFRLAAGHPPLAAAIDWRKAARDSAPPIPPDSRGGGAPLDLSPPSPAVDPADIRRALERTVRRATEGSRRFAFGRYGEARLPGVFPVDEGRPFSAERRSVSLGVEVFAPAGAAVRAVLAGEVVAAGADPVSGRGLRVELRHSADGGAFRSIYRGLTGEGAPEPGAAVAAGGRLGSIADSGENGGWPPHLQFQIALEPDADESPATDEGRLTYGDRLRAAAAPSDLEPFAALCPDPSPFLAALCGGESLAAPPGAFGREPRLLEERRRRLSPALSVAYDPAPIHIVRGRGSLLYDAAGRDYLDLVNNVCQVGHAHPAVAAAIAEQAARLNTNTRYLYDQLTDYAEALTATLPPPLEVVFLTNSGSEANDLALRIARSRVGNRRTIVFEGGYHGNLTSLIEVSPYKLDGPGGGADPEWLVRLPMPDLYRGRFRDAAGLTEDAVRRIEAAGPATLICEAIFSCGGQIVPPPGYLPAIYAAVRRAGGSVIADEVQTGFGRVGPSFWAFREVGEVTPDLVTFGKPAGNGHPLGGVVASRDLARAFETGMEYFNTFGGNPVSCAAGLAVLRVIREEGLAERAASVGGRLLAGLGELAGRYPMLGQVRGRGLFSGAELVRDPEAREPASAEAKRLVSRLRELRILNSVDGPDANVLKLKPPLVFSDPDTDRYLEVLDGALRERG